MSTSFLAAVADHPLVADGAMGTALRALLRDEEDGANLELLCLTRPELVRQVHGSYLAAGADLLQTNTYGANSLQFDLIQRPDVLVDVNRRAVELAREAAATVDRAIWIAGSVGPLGAIRYDFDVIRTDSIAAVYGKQMVVLKEAGVDLIVLETMDDYREIVGALRAATKLGLTVMLQLACPDGETVGGLVDLSAMVAQAEDLGAAIIGANCRLGPRRMVEVADRLVHLTRLPVSIQPNAGTYVVDRYGRCGRVSGYGGALFVVGRSHHWWMLLHESGPHSKCARSCRRLDGRPYRGRASRHPVRAENGRDTAATSLALKAGACTGRREVSHMRGDRSPDSGRVPE